MTAWGILSTARINRLILAGARESDRVDVVAVASRDRARAEAYAREHHIERAYGSYDPLLEDPDVEAVYISLPNSMHVEWTLRALDAGKHVLCEKPLSPRAQPVEEAFDLADRRVSSSRRASCGDTTRRRRRSPDSSPRARSGGSG